MNAWAVVFLGTVPVAAYLAPLWIWPGAPRWVHTLAGAALAAGALVLGNELARALSD